MAVRALKPGQKITDEMRNEVEASWRTGEYTQRELAHKYKLAVGSIAKICKGIDQDTVSIVSAGIGYKRGLQAINEQSAHAARAVITEVDKKVANIEYFDAAQRFLSDTAVNMVKEKRKNGELAMQEVTGASRVVRDSREGVVGKAPEVQIVNNQVSVHAQMSDRDLLEEARRIQERMKLIDSV